MRRSSLPTFLAAIMLLSAESGVAAPSPLAHRGFATDRATAERAIAFRPFVPDRDPLAVALEPPFHGGPISANEGIAYAYRSGSDVWTLSEWRANGGTLDEFAPLRIAQPHCTDVHAVGALEQPHGIVWRTAQGLVMSLIPAGNVDRRALLDEWRRLVRRGAC